MATVDGVFRIIDRASAPMRRMERQAQQTDRAIRHLALTTDTVGSNRQMQQLDRMDRQMQHFSRTVDGNDKIIQRHSRTLDQHVSRWDRFRDVLTRTGAALAGVGRILGALKLPLLGAAVGVAVQAVGALAGGIIALMPRIADLGGALFALGPVIAGIGGSLVTVKLAFNDVSKAMGGNQKALAALTPEARKFVLTLKQYSPVLKELRQSAQTGLFPGLTFSLARIQRAVPVAKQLLEGFGRTLGNLAREASTRFTSSGFLADLLGIGQSGQRVTKRGGESILNLVSAFRHLTAAAIPFTDWLTKMTLRASAFIDRWAQFQRDSGRFGTFLNRTRQSLTQFGHILENLWSWFRALGRAARPLGDILWRDAERATRAWAKYANSVQGQVKLTREFLQMRGAIESIFKLFDNLVRVIFRMGTSQALPGIVESLNKMIPALEKLLNLFVTTFGPVVADLLTQVTQIFTFLVGATGPINVFLTLLDRILRLFNNLISVVPGLNRVLAAALSVVTIGLFIGRVRSLALSWWSVATGAKAAAVAQAQALGGSAVAAGGLGRAVVAGEAMTAGGVILPTGVRGASTVAAAGRLAGLGARAGTLLRGAGKFALPVAATMAAFDAATAPRGGSVGQQIGQSISAAASGATFGLIPRMHTPGEKRDAQVQHLLSGYTSHTTGWQANRGIVQTSTPHAGLSDMIGRQGGENPSNLGQIRAQLATYRDFMGRIGAINSDSARQAVNSIRGQITVLKAVQSNLARTRAEASRALAFKTLRQEGTAFDIYSKKFGAAGATSRTTADVEGRLNQLPEAGRRILAQRYLAWIQEQAKAHPQMRAGAQKFQHDLVRIYAQMGTRIKIVNGQIVEGTRAQWKSIADAMASNVERARQAVSQGFTEIQQRAIGALTAMGVSRSQATTMVNAIEHGRMTTAQAGAVASGDVSFGAATSRRATGGRISAPGHDMSDRVHALVGKGELIVNRHTERKINHLLGGVTTLGHMAASESTPHSFKTGGRTATGGGMAGIQPGIRSVAEQVISAFPSLAVTSTTGGRHARNSYHYKGMAVDIGGDPSTMFSASNWIGKNLAAGLLEGIHNPNLSIKNGRAVGADYWGAKTWAQHLNHIHLAAGSGGAIGGVAGLPGGIGKVSFGQLAPGASGVPGVGGALADQAGNLMAAGFTRALNRKLGGMGAGMSTVAGGGAGGNQALAQQMMLKRWPASEWGALQSLWMGESGFRTAATNASSGAYGIPQALPGSKMASAGADWKTNPATQIAWGLNYIGGRYGTPSAAYQQWLGRSPHWYGDGGNFIARKPMLIGVGDREEHVSITPTHKRSAGGRPIVLQVNVQKIEHHGEGDTVRVIHREFEALAEQLKNLPTDDDNEALH